MGEDPRPRGRLVGGGYRPLTADAVRMFFRGVWKLAFVLAVTLAILTAIGWGIQAVADDGGSRGGTATTIDDR